MPDVESIQRLFVRALADPAFQRHGTRMGTWDVSRGCEDPQPVTQWSRSTGKAKNLGRKGVKPAPMIELTLLTPCRRCEHCLKRHAWLWSGRARTETEAASRTWFITLTASMDRHYWIDRVCSTRVGNFDGLTRSEKFREQAKVYGAEVTKWLKRLRKETGHRFRYLQVTEIHDGIDTAPEMRGRPHVHLLLHEYPGQPVRKEVIQRQWKMGFSTAKLVDNERQAAWYVSKYISKAVEVRTRASTGYGNSSQDMNM